MGSGASKTKRKHTERTFVGAASDDAADDVDPSDYVSGSQVVAHAGLVWKLNMGADPQLPSEWLRRKMWLTDSGGLFYFSRQFGRPVGRSVAELRVRVPEDKEQPADWFAFEIHTAEDELLAVQPTVLAASSVQERDVWVGHLRAVIEAAQQSGATGHVDPLEPIAGRTSAERRRMTSLVTSEPLLSASCPPDMAPMTSSMSYSDSLKRSLDASYMQHSQSLRSGLPQAVQDMHHTPSHGPSAFLARPGRSSLPSSKGRGQLLVRRDSQLGFAEKRNTILVLDWDDTLFPTTFIRQDCGFDWRYPINKQLAAGRVRNELMASLGRLLEILDSFLTLACSLATVVIVTLAKRPWVLSSADNFMPGLRDLLEKYAIPVIYAREKVTEEMKKKYSANVFKASDQEADFWMHAKASAMREQLEELYGGASWKNILSFGDSDFERVALVTTAEGYVLREKDSAKILESGLTSELISKDGHRKRLRVKTVKMLGEPAMEEMIAQLSLLFSWLPHLVERDSGIDVIIADSSDDVRLNELDLEVTGRSREMLTWRGLASLEAEE